MTTHSSSSSGINVHTAAPTTTISSSSSTPGIPNAAPPAAVEIPPIAPSVPAPFTPPNSPLPTPHVPNPPFLATPPPPSIPPQLLPPCPGNQPPPQKLIPNAPTADKAPAVLWECAAACQAHCACAAPECEALLHAAFADAAPKSSKKSASTSSSSTTSLSAAQDITAPATAAATSQSKKAEAASTNAAVQGLQQRWQGVQDAAQRDPGVSDFLKAAAKFGEAFVRVGLIVLRLLVQITAVLLQAAVKLLVWLLDWAGQRTADRVAAVRQQNAAQLGVAAVVQQQAGGQEKVMGMQVAMAAAAEQQAPDLAAPVV
ncbi:hypothetical protein OEZ85_012114 [Tetradesmus obliquus]|uniref:Uncharacterized protein n=1 Tax=Tetradesmus obliquus TaxID=3088 RepID=A0ABY8TSS3_TETOB|nr:hypothetical protein OEZ85_012114 [Tetradesmus obliquus]